MSQEWTFGESYISGLVLWLRKKPITNLKQSYYVYAQHACRSSRIKLRKLKLSALEEQLLNTTEGVNVALGKLKPIQEEEEKRASKSSFMEHTSSFVNEFSDFVVRISGIVQTMLPQSPEYTITYGVLLLIFKVGVASFNKNEMIKLFYTRQL